MILPRVLWPLLLRKMCPLGTPPWFRRRVLLRIDHHRIHAWPGLWHAGGCAVMLVPVTGILTHIGCDLAGKTWGPYELKTLGLVFLLSWPGMWAMLAGGAEIQAGWAILKFRRTTYTRAVREARAALTGHERLDLAACVGARLDLSGACPP